ncbi:MAG: aminotransferase class I/II-fold pyridoxal phosphate-dependent enzyme [Lachnospiraceae bacterium]|nr:aminotransferase class I/II-fold pyridoxal phosphate-dependent enzyme [Lachnospiraceae bacterium]
MGNNIHGGDIYRNKVNIDFSVSLNPMDWPYVLKQRIEGILTDLNNIHTYPDITYDRLRAAIAAYTGEPAHRIVCGNGASELISGIVNVTKPQRVLLVSPCFSGYERAVKAYGAEIIYAYTDEESGFSDTDVILECLDGADATLNNKTPDLVIIGNPSNPVGNLIPSEAYEKIVKKCEEKRIVLLVDECFTELSMSCDEYEKNYGSIRGRTLIRLRALTKSFRLAGLRLGYALCEDVEIAYKLGASLPEWNVSTIAMKAGTACLEYECKLSEESRYITASYEYIKRERERLAEALRKPGIRVYDGAAGFLLIHSEINLYEKLLEKGILIRDCANITGLDKGYYRLSLRDRTDDDRLIESIRDCYERI